MKKILTIILTLTLLFSCFFTSCSLVTDETEGSAWTTASSADPFATSAGDKATESTETGTSVTQTAVSSKQTEIPDAPEENTNTLTVTCEEGTDKCWAFDGNTLLFSGISENTVCSLSGTFSGQIRIDAGDDYKFELELCGVTLYGGEENPITVLSGDKVTLSAKKNTENFIYDTREAVSSEDETVYSAAVWSKCDLNVEGKGSLVVISSHNNGIHTKDDLKIKNLTLSVTCIDNALKGNDGVEIESGVITLIAKQGDGIKTVNTDISSKGNQRGIVDITGGAVTIYAACDGIDAAYDVSVSNEAVLTISTDEYSPYSETVEQTEEDEGVRYIRFTSKTYNYSVKYYNSDTDYVWVNASYSKSVSGGRSTYYYYAFSPVAGYSKVQFFIYASGQAQGQETDYTVKSDYMTWNTAYDTFALEARGSSLTYNWTNYSSSANGFGGFGGRGGMGGMGEGNTDKGDYSTKGIKAGNAILISGGTVSVESYDDALHANSETALENGETPTGDVVISGGTLTLSSKDDGIHADGTLTVSGGTVSVADSYEGLEGTYIVINGGDISVVSSDDGFNATTTSGTGITFNDGTVYVYAGGDGLDSNSRTSYQGIVFAGGEITVISTSGGNSSIDTESGYAYKGGKVLALCPSNGMGSESTRCQNFSSVATKATVSLKAGQTVTVKVSGSQALSVEMPCSLSALAIYLGSSSASFGTK